MHICFRYGTLFLAEIAVSNFCLTHLALLFLIIYGDPRAVCTVEPTCRRLTPPAWWAAVDTLLQGRGQAGHNHDGRDRLHPPGLLGRQGDEEPQEVAVAGGCCAGLPGHLPHPLPHQSRPQTAC